MDPFLFGIAAVMALGFAALWVVLRRSQMPDVDAALRQPDALVIDVRPPAAFRAEHYPHAINVPLSELRERAAELGARDRLVVVYADEPGQGAAAVRILRESGYERVIDGGDRDGMPSPKADVGMALFRHRSPHPR